MVSGISCSQKIFDLTSNKNNKTCDIYDEESAVRNRNDYNLNYFQKTYSSMGDSGTLHCSSEALGTFEEFKSYKRNKMMQEIVAADSDEASNLSRSEFLSRMDKLEEIVQSTDFEQGYKDYIKSRGCKDEKELQSLNKTGHQTKDDLIKTVARNLHCASVELSSQGFTSRNFVFDEKDMINMCSKMSIEDLSSYGTLVEDTGSPFVDGINEFQAFMSKVAQGPAMDDTMKQIFSEILEGITNSYKEIVKFSNKIDEQSKQFALEDKEKKIGENSEKYKEKLIVNYQK